MKKLVRYLVSAIAAAISIAIFSSSAFAGKPTSDGELDETIVGQVIDAVLLPTGLSGEK